MTRELESKLEQALEKYKRDTWETPRGALQYYMLTLIKMGKSPDAAAGIAAANKFRFDNDDYAEQMVRKCDIYEIEGYWED